jgi:hypothetical protein
MYRQQSLPSFFPKQAAPSIREVQAEASIVIRKESFCFSFIEHILNIQNMHHIIPLLSAPRGL